MKNLRKSYSCILLLFGAAVMLGAAPVNAAQTKGASFRIEFQDSGVVFHSDSATLDEILTGIYDEFRITVSGLSERQAQRVSMTLKGESIQDVMRRLFRHLGERNYAFQYAEDRLSHVSVFPESKAPAPVPSESKPSEPASSHPDFAVEVLDVVEGTQAQTIGLQKGDLILEYDGIRLNRASELVGETKNRTPFDTVELAVLRNGDMMRFFINGGLIGVRIKTVRIPNGSP